MRKPLTLLLSALPALLHAQSWNWATAFMGTGQPRVEAVAALADGGALVCGEFNDTLRTTADTIVTHGDWDGFLARLDDTGAVLWLHAIGGEGYDELNDIVMDANGNGFAATTFTDTVDWAGTSITGGAGREAALVKFDLDGNVLWYRRAAGYTYAYTVSVGSNGTAFLGGVINSSASFSGHTISQSAGIFNAFLVQYAADAGGFIDADVVSSSSGDFGAYGMDVDGAGNVYLTGYSRPQQNPYVGTFMAKIGLGDGVSWAQTVSSAFGDLYGRDVAATPDGHSYFTGNIYNNVTWMGQPLGQYGRYKNAYLARFSADGTLDWVQQYGNTNVDEGLGVTSDGLGNAYWTGRCTAPVNFDTIAIPQPGPFASQDVFVARTEPPGGVAWVSMAGGTSAEEMATAIDKRIDGPVIIGGQYASFQTYFGSILLPWPGRCFVASMAAPDDDLSTRVEEHTVPASLQISPVPARGEVFISMTGARGPISCTVLDALGSTVRSFRLGAPFGMIDVTGLMPGLYILHCTDAAGTAHSTRLIVE